MREINPRPSKRQKRPSTKERPTPRGKGASRQFESIYPDELAAFGLNRLKDSPSLQLTTPQQRTDSSEDFSDLLSSFSIQPFVFPYKFGQTEQKTPREASFPFQMDFKTERKLRRGKIQIDATLDLHGMVREEAQAALQSFITSAHKQAWRCLLVITGKGKQQPASRTAVGKGIFEGGNRETGVLKRQVPLWLSEPPLRDIVLKAVYAQPVHGGSGALYVYLRRYDKV